MDTRFGFTKLDAKTRALMIEEIKRAEESDQIYFSARFNEVGTREWPTWLIEAAEQHNEHWLAYQMEAACAMKHLEARAKPKGGYTVAHVPDTAAETMADGQFNRFYMAAVCRRAIEDAKRYVEVYRAKHRGEPRPESRALEGTARDARALLEELRGRDSSLKCDLLKANSGLSIDY